MKGLSAADSRLIEAIREQIKKSMELVLEYDNPRKKGRGRDRPLFVSVGIKDVWEWEIFTFGGALVLVNESRHPRRLARGEVRVGDYKSGCSVMPFRPIIPADNDPAVVRKEIWRCVNGALYEAVKNLNGAVNESIGLPENHNLFDYFSREKPVRSFKQAKISAPDISYWQTALKRISRSMNRPDILGCEASFSFGIEKRYFVNSEGTIIVDFYRQCQLHMIAETVGRDNVVFKNYGLVRARDIDKMPPLDELMAASERLIAELYETRDAPLQEAGAYPTIVDGENHGVIWHEAIGHALEGTRQREKDDNDEEDGNGFTSLSFKDKEGKKIAPDFLTVIDDPTAPGLNGSYDHDEEGVPAQKVALVENGVLKGCLHSRESAGSFGKTLRRDIRSNGHARAEDVNDYPMPRMSNIIVSAGKEHSFEELEGMLIEECKRTGKTYGLILRGTEGGFTDLENSFFRTVPRNVFRLYTDGRMERARGVYLVSTPYQMLENIVACSNAYQAFDGNCGAESGSVPTSQTAPDAFIKSVEFGVIPRSRYAKCLPFLSAPPA